MPSASTQQPELPPGKTDPEAPVFFEGGTAITRKVFHQRIRSIAALLGDLSAAAEARVLLDLPAVAWQAPAIYAARLAGCTAIPTAPETSAADQEAIVRAAAATHRLSLVVEGASPPEPQLSALKLPKKGNIPAVFDRLRERKHAGLVLFSSGTTGRAKGMLHDLTALLDGFSKTRAAPKRRTALLMHLDHIGGLDVLFRTLAAGGAVCVPAERTPEALARLATETGFDLLPATPTFLRLCLLQGIFSEPGWSSLQTIAYGAEPMPAALLEQLDKALPHVRILQTFGTSETGTIPLRNDTGDGLLRPKEGARAARVVNGELWLRTPNRILGYLHPSDATTEAALSEDGWFATGDLAESLPDGSIRLLGRKSRLISIGGEKADPERLRLHLLDLPGVADARVHALPHPISGHVLHASLTVASDSASSDLSHWRRLVRKHLSGRVPKWMFPVKIEVREGLPLITERLKAGGV